LKILLTAAGVFVIVIASGLLLLMWRCSVPSLNKLQRRFPAEQADLEIIVSMSDQDSQFTRIDPNWLMTADGYQYYWPGSPLSGTDSETAPMPTERWNQYRKLFSKDNISQGVERDTVSGDQFILVDSEGILDSGVSVGYVLCSLGAKHRYPPCVLGGDRGSQEYSENPRRDAYEYRHLTGRWYVYSEGPS
jgi:hypothetical protein